MNIERYAKENPNFFTTVRTYTNEELKERTRVSINFFPAKKRGRLFESYFTLNTNVAIMDSKIMELKERAMLACLKQAYEEPWWKFWRRSIRFL